tara:strand:+ start:5428 stop:5940 length:513 start_codon:yes stop_codon:yes gene_type:complete
MLKFKSNIEKLKVLTDSLIDRDYVRVKVLTLFDKFCNDFPIPMNAWIVDKDLNVISKKGSLICGEVNSINLNNIFDGENRVKNIKMHKTAFLGEPVTYTLKFEDKLLLTKLMPSSKDANIIFGVSMDITSFSDMVDAIDIHCKDIENNTCKTLNRVKNDPLYSIIKDIGE